MLNRDEKSPNEVVVEEVIAEVVEEDGDGTVQKKINFVLLIAVVIVGICAAVAMYQYYLASLCC